MEESRWGTKSPIRTHRIAAEATLNAFICHLYLDFVVDFGCVSFFKIKTNHFKHYETTLMQQNLKIRIKFIYINHWCLFGDYLESFCLFVKFMHDIFLLFLFLSNVKTNLECITISISWKHLAYLIFYTFICNSIIFIKNRDVHKTVVVVKSKYSFPRIHLHFERL